MSEARVACDRSIFEKYHFVSESTIDKPNRTERVRDSDTPRPAETENRTSSYSSSTVSVGETRGLW